MSVHILGLTSRVDEPILMRHMNAGIAPAGAAVLEGCSCLAGRRAARAVSQLYDQAMAAAQLTNGQLTLLAQIAIRPSSTVSALATRLLFERTTLTRNLQLMSEREMVAFDAGADRRQRFVRLTSSGERALIDVLPLWQDIQARLMKAMGVEGWERTLASLRAMAGGIASDRTVMRPTVRRRKFDSLIAETTILTDAQLELLRSQLCMATTVRRTNRAVTRHYDRSLRAVGLKTSQFHLLAAIDSHAGRRLGHFVDVLTLDQTTLTRHFQYFLRVGLSERLEDGPHKGGFVLTDPGMQLLREGLADWSAAQRLATLSGAHGDLDFNAEMSRIIEAAEEVASEIRTRL